MKWKAMRQYGNLAVSDCGEYEVRAADVKGRGTFYNAWHIPTEKHIAASYQKSEVQGACAQHAAKATQSKGLPASASVDASQRIEGVSE